MIGEVLGPYRIEHELGSGGMGRVYAATVKGRVPGLDTGTLVALKLVHPHLLETPGFFKRFLREVEIGRTIRHPNVVRTFDGDQLVVGGVHHSFLVMEHVEGQTLRDLQRELDRVPEELCRHIGCEVAKALAAIHDQGVVHRDIKPENIIIALSAASGVDDVAERPSAGGSRRSRSREGNVPPECDHVVKVMDLGVARLMDEAVRLSQTGAFVGSIQYAAPEQFGGRGGTDHRADLHALGLLLYELACGRHPYEGEDFRAVLKRLLHEEPRRVADVNPQLSPFYEEVVHTLIAKESDARFQTSRELVRVLEAGESSEWWQARARALRLETRQPLRRIRIPRETALYGRDAELARLRSLYRHASAGEGRVALIEGEAGIGKTRLIDEFVGQMRQAGDDFNFLFGSYPPGGAATAAGAFSTAYREHFGAVDLETTLRDYLPTTPLLIPAFAALLTGDATPADKEPLTKDSLQTVFVHATRALAAERPTIVLIDDLHFAPDDGRALFAALAAAVAEHPILLLGTARPGLPGDWTANVERLEHATRLTVERLFPKDLIRLLEDCLRSDRLAERLGVQIAVKSDGNPFFVFEIIHGLREGQFITQQEDGSWVSTRVIDQIQIPSSVMDLIQARIADLTEEERELLDVAACCGFDFDGTLVAEALGEQRIPTFRRLGRIEKKHRLVRSVGRRHAFDHHQVQEALHSGLSVVLREEYHAALAEALESREDAARRDPADLDGALCVDLCEHYLKGARGENAVRYLDAALDHLDGGYLKAQAIELAGRALAPPGLLEGGRRVEVLLRTARTLDHLGRRDDEGAALDEALELARSIAAESGDPGPLARVEGSLGYHLRIVGRYAEAEDALTRAAEHAREADDAKTLARATGDLGGVFQRQGRLEEAATEYERARESARKNGDRGAEAGAVGNLGNVFRSLGRYEEAREHNERSLALHREAGDLQGEAVATLNLGTVLSAECRYGDAIGHYERAVRLAREIGLRQTDAIASHNLAAALFALGDPARSREYQETACAIGREIGLRALEPHAAHALALLAESAGDGDQALARYEETVAIARDLGMRGFLPGVLCALGGSLAQHGRSDEARRHAEEALGIALETKRPMDLVIARCHLAVFDQAGVDAASAALAEHEEHLDRDTRMEASFLLWEATHDRGHLAKAKRLQDEAFSQVPEERHEAMRANVPMQRRVAAAADGEGL